MVALSQNLYVYDNYGLVDGALQGPLRPSLAYWGDGLFFEQGTTNLITNPNFETNITGVTAGGTAVPVIQQTSLRCMRGTFSLLTTWAAGAASSGTVTQTPTIAATGAHTASVWVWVPAGMPAVTLNVTAGTATIASVVTATSSVTGKWQRLSCTFTCSVVGTVNVVLSNAATATAGQYFFSDSWQLENSLVGTSYCDGAQGTLWNSPGWLKTWDFEDGTTGSFTASAGTLAVSTVGPYLGTYDLRATATGANLFVRSPTGLAGVAAVAGKTYSGIAWVKPSVAHPITITLEWWNSSGTLLGSTVSSSYTPLTTNYIKLAVTGQAPTGTAFVSFRMDVAASASTETYDIDSLRIEEGAASACYRWTGIENASTSTRIASSLIHAVPGGLSATNNHSVAVRVTPGYTIAQTRTLFTIGQDANNYIAVSLDSSGNLTSTSVVASTATAGPSVNLGGSVGGDQLLVGYTLTAAGVFTLYGSKNGAAFVTASLTNAAYNGAYTLSRMCPGTLNATSQWLDGSVEHLLFYNAALVQADFDSLRTTNSEPTYNGDTRLLYAFLTQTYRNNYQALTAAGVGQNRQRLATTCYLENNIVQTNISADDDNSTTKISVPTGSGIGIGDTVSLSAGSSTQYTVKQVFAPGGTYDELWVA